MLLATMIGFVIAYIVLLKSLLPLTIEGLTHKKLPDWMGSDDEGQVFWALIFSFLIVFPLSLARNLSALRFSSFFSFICGIYVVLVIVFVCLVNRETTPELGPNLATAATEINVSVAGIFNSFPLIVFSFMYQPNIPAIYHELNKRELPNMRKVMIWATGIAIASYVLAGFFGYATFDSYEDVQEIM